MLNYDPPGEKEPTDYTGLKIVGILLPVFLLITLLESADRALTICIVLGVTIVAIKIHWHLHKRFWFWTIVISLLLLHVPLFLVVRWPQGKVPTIFYTMPLGVADFLIISGALRLAEKLLAKDSPFSDLE